VGCGNDLRVAVAAVAGPAAGIGSAYRGCRFWAVRPVVMCRYGEEAHGRPSCRREVCPTEACFPPPGGKALAWV